jgi:chromosome segregation ATPase
MCKPDDCFECRSICEFRGKLDQPEFRIAALEAELREREAECERLRGEDAGADTNIRELWARVQSAEAALAAAREEIERLRENQCEVCDCEHVRMLDVQMTAMLTIAALVSPNEPDKVRDVAMAYAAELHSHIDERGNISDSNFAERKEALDAEYRAIMEDSKSELAALRSRADDAGRVERARKAFPSGRIPDEWSIDEVIEAVLAAADGEVK